jgi:two-component system chemotaxis sensor kinase CheA
MTPLLQHFIQESQDSVQAVGEKLMALEASSDDAALMDELFRLVHTLKGNSGLFDFPEMTRVLHAAEDLMDAVRDRRVDYSTALADRFLDAMDFVGVLLDEVAVDETINPVHVTRSHHISESIQELLPVVPQIDEVTHLYDTLRGKAVNMQDEVLNFCEADRVKAWCAAAKGSPLFLAIYRPDDECFYKGEDPFYRVRHTPGLIAGGVIPKKSWESLAALDCYQCTLEFRMLLALSRGELEEHFRYTPEQLEVIELAPTALVIPVGERHSSQAFDTFVNEAIDLLRKNEMTMLNDLAWALLQLTPAGQWPASVLRWLLIVNETAPQTALMQSLIRSLASLESPDQTILHAAKIDASSNPTFDSFSAPNSDSKPIDLLSTRSAETEGITPALTSNEKQEKAKVERVFDNVALNTFLKVDQAKIDLLMDLIGEMVVAKNALPYLASRAEMEFGVRDLSRQIKTQYAVINRIAEDMQHTIMQVRMTPISFIFQRFPRLVRDMSRKLGKNIELILDGEETAADKSIVEALADPLIHIVRNSLDHGLETPEVRERSGKSSTGRLRICAMQEPDHFIIEISDDGRGIDPSIIKQKAFEKGMINSDQLESLSSQQAINLIFFPGFSTAEKITDLSGRGVGMDVVKNSIEKLGGSVDLFSEIGHGTTLRLSLPLSMAMTNVIIVEADEQIFGMPMDWVVETVRVDMKRVHTINHKKVVMLRDRVMPLYSLHALLGLDAEPLVNDEGELSVLVIRINHDFFGLLVDSFNEVVDVILKPLPGELKRLNCYSGSALLGDGSVLIVLNPGEMFL